MYHVNLLKSVRTFRHNCCVTLLFAPLEGPDFFFFGEEMFCAPTCISIGFLFT